MTQKTSIAAFTLMELMIAIAVIATGMAAYCSSLGMAQQVQTRTSSEQLALQQVERVIEQIQNTNFNTVQTSWNNKTFAVAGVQSSRKDAVTGAYQPAGLVAVDTGKTTLSEIWFTISVAWQDLQGPGSVSVTYVHVNRGI